MRNILAAIGWTLVKPFGIKRPPEVQKPPPEWEIVGGAKLARKRQPRLVVKGCGAGEALQSRNPRKFDFEPSFDYSLWAS